jgi:hypothetical protein
MGFLEVANNDSSVTEGEKKKEHKIRGQQPGNSCMQNCILWEHHIGSQQHHAI